MLLHYKPLLNTVGFSPSLSLQIETLLGFTGYLKKEINKLNKPILSGNLILFITFIFSNIFLKHSKHLPQFKSVQ